MTEIVEEYRRVVIGDVEYPYEVSDIGNVRRIGSDKCLKPTKDKDGYLLVGLSLKGAIKKSKVHRLVAIAFIENADNKPQVDHIDGNKHNNRVENVRWATAKENIRNQGKTKCNKTGFKGVSFCKREHKFLARIKTEGKTTHLGYFKSAEEAFEVYKAKALEIHGEFARF